MRPSIFTAVITSRANGPLRPHHLEVPTIPETAATMSCNQSLSPTICDAADNHPGFGAHVGGGARPPSLGFIGKVAAMPSKYDEQTRSKAVRLVQDHQSDYASEWEAIKGGVWAAGDER
jgi:hypothetical protein